MKKLLLLAVAACVLPLTVDAQEAAQTNKDKVNKVYLPEAGDWAISFDAVPVLRFVGNLFNNSTDNSLEALGGKPVTSAFEDFADEENIAPDVSVMVKYMLTDEWALRANVGFMVRSQINKSYVNDQEADIQNPLGTTYLIDQSKMSRNGASLMVGAEYRRGKRRVQGVFGMGLLFGLRNTKASYTYGNALTSLNQHPETAFTNVWSGAYRLDKQRTASDIFVGAMGSAGVEWFVAPKVSLGAEVNLSLYYIFGGQQWKTSTGFNAVRGEVEQRTDLISPGNDYFGIGTNNVGGSLNVSFYF